MQNKSSTFNWCTYSYKAHQVNEVKTIDICDLVDLGSLRHKLDEKGSVHLEKELSRAKEHITPY